MERKTIVVVSAASCDHEGGCECDGGCEYSLEHKVDTFSLEDFLSLDWVKDDLKLRGFYSKDEVGVTNEYLDKYIYEYGAGTYKYFTKNPQEIPIYDNIIGVYQEVIGPERLKACAKWKASHEKCLKQQAGLVAKQLEKKILAAEKRRLKAVENAKRILQQEEAG